MTTMIDIHMLQNFPPSNLNRDDTGGPKECEFGGVRRARVSSQCIKRSVRFHPAFAAATGVPLATRSRLMVNELVRLMVAANVDEKEARKISEEFAAVYSSKDKKLDDQKRTVVLLYISVDEYKKIAENLVKIGSDFEAVKKYAAQFAKEVRENPTAPDIAMFGRMLSYRTETNIDAACQVAHAISTHQVDQEFDYFTAVDDLQDNDATGAAMIGSTGFNSACFYRYACVDFERLVGNLGGNRELAIQTLRGFMQAFYFSIPSGKQNAFGARTLPSFAMAVVREGEGYSLANAFEKPVHNGNRQGIVAGSLSALDRYWTKLTKVIDDQSKPVAVCIDCEDQLGSLKDCLVPSVKDWENKVVEYLEG